jgi:hypothetical protein
MKKAPGNQHLPHPCEQLLAGWNTDARQQTRAKGGERMATDDDEVMTTRARGRQ